MSGDGFSTDISREIWATKYRHADEPDIRAGGFSVRGVQARAGLMTAAPPIRHGG